MARDDTTRRSKILSSLVEKFEVIDGTGSYKTDLTGSISPRMMFWDEVSQFPAVHMSAGMETRQYYGGGNKWRFLNVTIRVYVNGDDPIEELEEVLEDLETVLDANSTLGYEETSGLDKNVVQITLISIDTDEGALAPLGVGEMVLELRY
jgi:tetrahydromethanopterin S-methyltransferase subunit B